MRFRAEYARSGRSICTHCKAPITAGELRLGPAEYVEKWDRDQVQWHHPMCFAAAGFRVSSKDSFEGVSALRDSARRFIEDLVTRSKRQRTSAPAVFEAQTDSWQTSFRGAVRRNDEALVIRCLSHGVSADCEISDGVPALLFACHRNFGGIVRALLDGGANINCLSARHETPLFLAAYNGHEALVVDLLARGADATIANISGVTPLQAAAQRGHAAIAARLEAHLRAAANEDPPTIHFDSFENKAGAGAGAPAHPIDAKGPANASSPSPSNGPPPSAAPAAAPPPVVSPPPQPSASDPAVLHFLEEAGVRNAAECAELFAAEDVDLDALLLLTAEDLALIGIKLGSRRKILAAIERRKAAQQQPTTTSMVTSKRRSSVTAPAEVFPPPKIRKVVGTEEQVTPPSDGSAPSVYELVGFSYAKVRRDQSAPHAVVRDDAPLVRVESPSPPPVASSKGKRAASTPLAPLTNRAPLVEELHEPNAPPAPAASQSRAYVGALGSQSVSALLDEILHPRGSPPRPVAAPAALVASVTAPAVSATTLLDSAPAPSPSIVAATARPLLPCVRSMFPADGARLAPAQFKFVGIELAGDVTVRHVDALLSLYEQPSGRAIPLRARAFPHGRYGFKPNERLRAGCAYDVVVAPEEVVDVADPSARFAPLQWRFSLAEPSDIMQE